MMEECGNNEHGYHNENETYASMNNMSEVKETRLDYKQGADSTDTEISNSETDMEGISREKSIIPNINIEQVKEGYVGIKKHKNSVIYDNIGESDDGQSLEKQK